jgi:hypothetical protein
MMNSPFMAEQVHAMVQRKDFPKSAGDDEKVRFVFKNVLQRNPTAEELSAALAFLNSAPEALVETNALLDASIGTSKKGAVSTAPVRALTPFERYVQVVLLTNEFMYVR